MRALRDFNTPKIVTEDTSIFMGLIGDLFPALDVPRKRNFEFEKQVHQAAVDLKLQPEENFILKVHFYYIIISLMNNGHHYYQYMFNHLPSYHLYCQRR